MAAKCFWPRVADCTIKSAHWLTGLNNNSWILSSSQSHRAPSSRLLDDSMSCVCVCVWHSAVTQHHHTMCRMAEPNRLTNVKCECGLLSVRNPAADAADAKRSPVSNSHPENFCFISPWPQLVVFGDYEIQGTVDGRCFFFFLDGGGGGLGDWGWLIDIHSACIVVLLSNHTESSCVRCIKAACYATYGMEKSGLYNPGRATAGVTYCVQSHPSTVQWQL